MLILRPMGQLSLFLFITSLLLSPLPLQAAQEEVPYCHRYADFNFPDYMALWNEEEPELTASTYFSMLNMAASSADKTFLSELFSQIGRTFLIREDLEQAKYYLAQAEVYLGDAEPRARAYFLREKARYYAYSEQQEQANELLLESWDISKQEQYEQLAIETALDLSDNSIAKLNQEDRDHWRQIAERLAASTKDERAKIWVLQNQSRFI
ncbi:hypothetical protein C9J01_09665 [Photobacterium rosenbergii]|uniref:Sel1 repeat family protein n=1 Tax=Photobacterium rosenbergii TaxID=294936 RepID=A0A2T3NI22_9GAMM|nr:hypothetical protein [Photobacterium rosenbergii]PSW14675.1 hypothetical protein C9J01_09665 [Photobacterium rosenbergii]